MRDNLGNVIYEIGKPTQLALHAGLGAGVAALSGGDALSGAVSGVVGEMTGEYLRDSVYGSNPTITRDQASQIAGLTGGLSAVIVGNGTGLDDSEVADNVYGGQRIGGNAARENALYIGGKVKIPYSDLLTGKGNDYDVHSGVKADLVTKSYSIGTDGKSKNLTFLSLGAGGYISVTPHNSNTLFGASYSRVPGILFWDAMQTDRGTGFGLTLGIFATPPIKAGATIKPPEQK